MIPKRSWLGLALSVCAACGWFDDGRTCEAGAFSCAGDQVRACVPKTNVAMGANGPQTAWQTIETCEDDPYAGPRTCAVDGERARCVAESLDGGVVDPEVEGEADWLRVAVSADGEVLEVEPQTLKGAPMGASAGAFVVVAYRGDRAVDAVLVPAPADGQMSTAWLRADGTSTVAVVDKAGKRLTERAVRVETGAKGRLGERRSALSAEMPSTLRVAGADTKQVRPLDWITTRLRPTTPTAEMLRLVGTPLLRLPTPGVAALTDVVFADQGEPDPPMADAGVDGGVDDGGGIEAGQLEADAAVAGPTSPFEPQRRPWARSALTGTVLWVDMSDARLDEYRHSPHAVQELELELVRTAGRAFFGLTGLINLEKEKRGLIPTDLPPELAALVQSRISPMLLPNEGLNEAWMKLHQVGVDSGLSAWFGARISPPPDDQAVDFGFASAAGMAGALEDFTEYMARVAVPNAWPEGPCDEIRGRALEELAPRRFVNIAKLEVLRGLGVVSSDAVIACTGTLLSRVKTPSVVLHKPNGEPVRFDGEGIGTRAEWDGTVSILASARRAMDQQAVLNVQYKGVGLPSVMRLGKPVNPRVQSQGATFAMTDLKKFETTGAEGGLVVIDQVTRQGIEAHVLLLQLPKPKLTLEEMLWQPELALRPFGTLQFPLVTVRVELGSAGWQDAEGADAKP